MAEKKQEQKRPEAPFSYYDTCKAHEIISVIRMQLERGGWWLRDEDGKITMNARTAWNSPWHHVQTHPDLDCNLWHSIMFDVFSQQGVLGKPFVPSSCQNCYKVVVRPKTLIQLFALLALQKQLELPSKCGIEIRSTVCGLYGGYFYNLGLEAGRNCYRRIRHAVDQFPDLGPDVPIILKRACTEFELTCGDSDKWEITPEQVELEALIRRTFVCDLQERRQPDHLIANVHRKWVEYAYMNADETYRYYTQGKRLYPAPVTYHDDIEAELRGTAKPSVSPKRKAVPKNRNRRTKNDHKS